MLKKTEFCKLFIILSSQIINKYMPQFDFYAFSTQVFWAIILFFAFYFVFTQIFLPKIAEVLKLREKRKTLKKHTENVKLFSLMLLYLI